jgi:hypothetical protein
MLIVPKRSDLLLHCRLVRGRILTLLRVGLRHNPVRVERFFRCLTQGCSRARNPGL